MTERTAGRASARHPLGDVGEAGDGSARHPLGDVGEAESAEPIIRPYRAADREGIADVCLRTAAVGDDATGVYRDDTLMPEVFALPYLDYDPTLAFVVADGERVLGYVIGVADTSDFIEWWKRAWAPGFRQRHPRAGASTDPDRGMTEVEVVEAGLDPERMRIPELGDYPAHLHIDLLPEAQRRGFGRRLIEALSSALADRGVPAVHLGVDPTNLGAIAFYRRLGFRELDSSRPDAPLLGLAVNRSNQ